MNFQSLTHKVFNLLKNNIRLLVIIFFVLFIYNSPHLISYVTTPNGYVYLKQAAWFDHWDQNLYVSAINYSQNNGYGYSNTYTTLPHQSLILYPLYTATGSIFRNYDPFLIFHALNLVIGTGLVVLLYGSSKIFLKNKSFALIATILACLGGGIGWIVFKSYLPPDIRMPYFTFITTFQRPHEGLAILLFFSSITLLYLYLTKNKLKYIIASSVLLALSLRFYMFLIANYYLILLIWTIVKFIQEKSSWLKQSVNAGFVSLIICLPIIIHTIYLVFSSTSFETVLFHPNVPTITPMGALVGYGIMGFVFIYQLFFVKKSKEIIFVNCWFMANLLLSLAPMEFSRYFLRGQFFPLSIIFVTTIYNLPLIKKIDRKILYAFLLIFIPFSTYVVFFMRLISPLGFNSRWNYAKISDMNTIQLLNDEEECSVLSDFRTANIIPVYTNCNVYVGHTNQTPDSERKRELAHKIIVGELSQDETYQLIEDNYVTHLLVADRYWRLEQSKNKNLEEVYPFIELIHREDNSSLYVVKDTNLDENMGGDGGS